MMIRHLFIVTVVLVFSLTSCKKEEAKVLIGDKVNIPGHLCIYYGYPSLVNGANGNITKATQEFLKFDLIVFGDGLSNSNHPDHQNTKRIISGLKGNTRTIFGYVDLGVSTNNYNETILKDYISNWAKIGVDGIFFDDAGSDYEVTRQRQNVAIKLCRDFNLKVFMNAWNPDDVFSGSDCLLTKDDFYLFESILVGHDKYTPLKDWYTKAEKCKNYSKSLGIKIACVSTGGDVINADYVKTNKFSLAWVGTAMYDFPYFQASNTLYSSNNNIVFFFPNLSASYGDTWKRNDEVIKVTEEHYLRHTNTHSLNIFGNGTSNGNGEIIKNKD